ncbi:MAG: hypothetical protein IKV55_03090, partial [Oscillospiraceae bacterium]|nr:hypothetical protein [Oscillospiraceae bacterium]
MLKPEVRLALEFTAGLVLAAVAMSSLDLGINFATFLGLVLALVFTVVCELLWVKKETDAEAYITFKGDDTVLLKA